MRLSALFALALTAAACLAGQGPRTSTELLVAEGKMSVDEAALLARSVAAPVYLIVPEGVSVTITSAPMLVRLGERFGEAVAPSTTLEPGTYWSATGSGVSGLIDGVEPFAMEMGGVLFVGTLDQPAAQQEPGPGSNTANTCTSTCGVGYFACCNYGSVNPPRPTCVCVLNSQIPHPACAVGGPGSTGCSITQNRLNGVDLAVPHD